MNHKFISLWRIIRAGLQNFIRNATLSIAAMAVMVITLTIILFSVIANATFSHTVKQITDGIDFSVYLNDNVSEQQVQGLLDELRQIENVKDLRYKNKAVVLEEYKEQNKANLDLLLAVSQIDNPLPPTINIKPKDPNRIQEIKMYLDQDRVKALQSYPTSYSGVQKLAIDKVSKATRFFSQISIVGVAVFAFVSILIIFNTIRMTIFNRRDELTIMRLLGASSRYIRGPFVVETLIYGIVSALISISLCKTLFYVAANTLDASSLGLLDITFSSQYFAAHFWIISASQLSLGILIGAGSSLIATKRYLKFKSS